MIVFTKNCEAIVGYLIGYNFTRAETFDESENVILIDITNKIYYSRNIEDIFSSNIFNNSICCTNYKTFLKYFNDNINT